MSIIGQNYEIFIKFNTGNILSKIYQKKKRTCRKGFQLKATAPL